jgi:large subunit ribosomal protein L18
MRFKMKNNDVVLYRRKREGRTNYKKRLILLKSKRPRLIIRKTNTQIIVQAIEYLPDGDKTLAGINSSALKKLGWNYSCNNTPACYLAGILLGRKAKDAHIKELIPDFGLQSNIPGSRLYAVLKGVLDAGVHVPVDESVLPKKERIMGAHIANYYAKAKDCKQFSAYNKNKVDASKISNDVELVKKKILQ